MDNQSDHSWIRFDGRVYQIKSGETALNAMLMGGAQLPFSCRKGTCHSCMLEAVSGDPGPAAIAKLPENLREQNLFLPCMCDTPNQVEARLPDRAKLLNQAVIAEKSHLSESIVKILLEPEQVIEWHPGQTISIQAPDGDFRTYSIVSAPDDYFVEIHLRHYPNGKLSDWIETSLSVGDSISFFGPTGNQFYQKHMDEHPLIFISTGSGGGALLGVLKTALVSNPNRPIEFYHGASRSDDLYLADTLVEFEKQHEQLRTYSIASQQGEKRRVADVAFAQDRDLSETVFFLCGAPEAVERARINAVGQGVELENIYSDPFEYGADYWPQDREKIASVAPMPELWAALDNGRLLTEILEKFYTQVFEDERLAPYFQKVTKQRLIEKQYAFLADLFLGKQDYFGDRPFNAHHWMVISDDLFDYRERLFFQVIAPYGIPQKYLWKWAAIHELFRREIVKDSMRGQIFEGREIRREGVTTETISVATICCRCENELKEGDHAQYHERTGELFCMNCAGKTAPE